MLPLDVTASEEKLQKAAAQADSAFDGRGIDILVHNAGLFREFQNLKLKI